MATVIRPEISEKNKYWIGRHRYYELKHFCLQYSEWKRLYNEANESIIFAARIEALPSAVVRSDLTAKYAIKKAYYSEKIKLVESIAKETDEYLYNYILKAVTEDLSYTYFKSTMSIPCGRDMYYDRYRRFFWLLSEARD